MTRGHRGFAWLTLVAVLGVSNPSQAQTVYKWQDESGRWQFSDTPPANPQNVEKKRIKSPNTTSDAQTNAEMGRVFKPESEAERAYRDKNLRQGQAADNAKAQWCDAARKRLAIIKGPVIFTDKDGTPLKVTEEERAQRALDLERLIRQRCTP